MVRRIRFLLAKLTQRQLRQNGQALVVLLLILVVTLTVGLSVVSRTITNIQESSTTQRSSQAFEAAEAGVESTLRQNIPSLLNCGQSTCSLQAVSVGGATSNITVSKSGANTNVYQPEKQVSQDDVIQLDVNPADCNCSSHATKLNIYWSLLNSSTESPQNCTPPSPIPASLEISVVTYDGTSNYGIQRWNYNNSGCSGALNNGFSPANSDPNGQFSNYAQLQLPNNSMIVRLRPIYNSATLRIVPDGSTQIPVQSYIIRSEGVSGDTKRVVQVERSIGGLPSIFDYVLFNGSSTQALTK